MIFYRKEKTYEEEKNIKLITKYDCMYCNDACGSICGTGEGTVSLRTVEINVEAENTENDDYKIDDGFINLRKTDVQYVLTGTTDRKIQIWGSNSPDPVKTFHIRLNEATINGGIDINNSDGAELVVEVGEGKTNYVKNIRCCLNNHRKRYS